MRFPRFFALLSLFVPFVARAASDDFTMAAQLLAAAKGADIQRVQVLISNGANINYVDSTGLSLVCTAVMNNDLRAVQILQMYGADSSQCDRQIKNYQTRNSSGQSSGIFGGLSTAQNLALAAAGAGVVVGGLYLLTDVFDHDNNNASSGGGSGNGGSGSGGSGGGETTDDGNPIFGTAGLPNGPASLQPNYKYENNFELYYAESPFSNVFQSMNLYGNYLLAMRGYSPFARGYLGLRTLRDANNAPLALADNILGGRPVNVALVTANGINANATSSLTDNVYFAWSGTNGNGVSNKYYNNLLTVSSGANSVTEDTTLLSAFDLSNSGTAIHNTVASGLDDLLAKIVGGYTPSTGVYDFMGFMPNGQMSIYRTGGGHTMVELTAPVNAGTCEGSTISNGDTIGLFDKTLTATVNGMSVSLSDGTDTYNGYIGADGLLYIDSDGDGLVDMGYSLSNGLIAQTKQLQSSDYYNYSALLRAWALRTDDTTGTGRSKVDVIANVNVIEPLHNRLAGTINSVLSVGESNYATIFDTLINQTYGNASSESSGLLPADNAKLFFLTLNSSSLYKKTNPLNGGLSAPLVVFSTGGSEQMLTGNAYKDELQVATFENAAPIMYPNLEHLFMSIVAVQAPSITDTTTTIVPNSNGVPGGGMYQLSQWDEVNGATTSYYKSRICGAAGTGNSGAMDPWCFAAIGRTDEEATAAAAGAAGILSSAFHYMTPEQIFLLLALTADGPYLGRLTTSTGTGNGALLNKKDLASYLQTMYIMPNEYTGTDITVDQYLENFQQVYGYGVINLERATTPASNVFVFDGNNIVSSPNNAYWRAAINTGLRSSGALNLARGAINLSAYDILESIDGSMRLPRIWENNVALGDDGRHGLYMGDVLGELQTRKSDVAPTQIGNLSFSMSVSPQAYDDGMGGLKNMRFDYAFGNWNFGADYQHYLTDGAGRFDGTANPVLALASNAVSSDIQYQTHGWSFGTRAFSGAITDEGLLQNDPVVSANWEPMQLGTIDGVQSNIGWSNRRFGFNTSIGIMHESNTVLGAYATGLFAMGDTQTNYVDANVFWQPTDALRLHARATFAHSMPGAGAGGIMKFSELDSNAFAFGADIGNFDFVVSVPLAVHRGSARYAYANYDIMELDDGRYDLVVSDTGVREINLASHSRELRLNATYRHHFGEFTDGALGFIYRINPNNTNEFGNESVFMLKMSHRLGI